ncbi:MAG TPA: hemerythrin domain-containing protein [Usitatibacter sp.]|jgi:hemerythrin-like domain-containing protein|nr:hemerythrin domain-containing protein [Usitatibacter sp.]
MKPDDLPPGFDEPVDALLGFHRRIERQLAALGRLPAHLALHGLDAEASGLAGGTLEFFTDSIALHHADEEDLLPMLDLRASAERRDALRELRGRMESEHREMDRAWRTLRRPLEAISEGMVRALPLDLMGYFRSLHAGHIALEESSLHLEAARSLKATDRAALGRGMVARRMRRRRFA